MTDVAKCVIELNGSELQISANSFQYIMRVTDGGLPLLLESDRSHVAAYLEKYNVTSSGLCIANNVLPGFNAYAYVKQYHYSVLNFLLAYIAHE